MTNEINSIVKRAELEVKTFGKIGKGTYFDVLVHAIAGDAFAVSMTAFQANSMRAHFTRRRLRGKMHQRRENDLMVRVYFNCDAE